MPPSGANPKKGTRKESEWPLMRRAGSEVAKCGKWRRCHFQNPIQLQIYNLIAKGFTNDTTYKSKLKHIDVRQEWVKTLRDKNILCPVHVDTHDNLADLFTKILPKGDFQRLRDSMMKQQSSA